MTHPAPSLIARYATGDRGVDDATVWALEAHLESCAGCRSGLAAALAPDLHGLLDRASVGIDAAIGGGPAPVPVSRGRRLTTTARLWPWPVSAVVLVLMALGLDRVYPQMPSLVMLLAPVVPLIPVAAVWSRPLDPAWELTSSAPRGGLWLLLRRTLAMMLALLPVLTVAGLLTGHSPAVWLLPALALTAGSLLGGPLVGGVDRAAVALGVIWAAAVVVPSLQTRHAPAVLTAGSQIWWALVTAALVAVLGAQLRHRGDFSH
ncbi:zf-HC2 domain-containing protein [Kineosporia mesophila]|uniref:Zf-HC2 domain-containing protein n=1 Tax=Kineosporia mesophila TaxID=566012 RepID=A0ABP7A5H2_9ACTN|nr:zf-HC2 domain-containing protein [Kineosporia mesophila]MCD5351502.1 zf-HC2 domain-containing protein [Kineosporia mesophila]